MGMPAATCPICGDLHLQLRKLNIIQFLFCFCFGGLGVLRATPTVCYSTLQTTLRSLSPKCYTRHSGYSYSCLPASSIGLSKVCVIRLDGRYGEWC